MHALRRRKKYNAALTLFREHAVCADSVNGFVVRAAVQVLSDVYAMKVKKKKQQQSSEDDEMVLLLVDDLVSILQQSLCHLGDDGNRNHAISSALDLLRNITATAASPIGMDEHSRTNNKLDNDDTVSSSSNVCDRAVYQMLQINNNAPEELASSLLSSSSLSSSSSTTNPAVYEQDQDHAIIIQMDPISTLKLLQCCHESRYAILYRAIVMTNPNSKQQQKLSEVKRSAAIDILGDIIVSDEQQHLPGDNDNDFLHTLLPAHVHLPLIPNNPVIMAYLLQHAEESEEIEALLDLYALLLCEDRDVVPVVESNNNNNNNNNDDTSDDDNNDDTSADDGDNLMVYHAALTACARLRDDELSFQILSSRMEEAPPDTISYNLVLSAISDGTTMPRRLLEQMQLRRIPRDVISYRNAILALSVHSNSNSNGNGNGSNGDSASDLINMAVNDEHALLSGEDDLQVLLSAFLHTHATSTCWTEMYYLYSHYNVPLVYPALRLLLKSLVWNCKCEYAVYAYCLVTGRRYVCFKQQDVCITCTAIKILCTAVSSIHPFVAVIVWN